MSQLIHGSIILMKKFQVPLSLMLKRMIVLKIWTVNFPKHLTYELKYPRSKIQLVVQMLMRNPVHWFKVLTLLQ